jgi:EPS-associated MarR family transcriptional regulator
MQDEVRYKLLNILDKNPEATQRQLADQLGVSVGKINYCLAALIDKGQIKVRNFTNSNNKAAYTYLLTPKGVKEKARVTLRFLKRKIDEYEQLQVEIEQLRREAKSLGLQRACK